MSNQAMLNPSDPGQHFPFRRLPLELRLRIYTHHLKHPNPIRIWEDSKPSVAISLLKTNRQISSEATPIFYGANTFQLWCARVCTCAGIHGANAPYCFQKRPDTAVTRFIECIKLGSAGQMIKNMEMIIFSPLSFAYSSMTPRYAMMSVRLPPQFKETFTALQSVKVAFAVTECPWGVPVCRYTADFCTGNDMYGLLDQFRKGLSLPREEVKMLKSISGIPLQWRICWGRVEDDKLMSAQVCEFFKTMGLMLVLGACWGMIAVLAIPYVCRFLGKEDCGGNLREGIRWR